MYQTNMQSVSIYSCLLRIVDSFGTVPAYNLRSWAKSHKILTTWGGQDLQPQQFFTMFRKFSNYEI